MKRLAQGVLAFVGLEYVVLGVGGCLALAGSEAPLLLCFFLASFGLVAPLAIVEVNGIEGFAPNSNPHSSAVQDAHLVIALLSVVAIVGGATAIWGAFSRFQSISRFAINCATVRWGSSPRKIASVI